MRSLKQKKYRREYQSFVIEGVRSIQSAIEDNVRFESVFLSSDFEQDRIPELKKIPSNIIHDIPQSTMKKNLMRFTILERAIIFSVNVSHAKLTHSSKEMNLLKMADLKS